MGFKVSKLVSEYKWPTKVQVPNNGKYDVILFTGIYRKPNEEERAQIAEDLRGGSLDLNDLARRIFAGWEDGQVQDEDGEPLPATPENVARLLADDDVRDAVIAAYTESRQGKAAARKN
jgi:hypothetical protein